VAWLEAKECEGSVVDFVGRGVVANMDLGER